VEAHPKPDPLIPSLPLDTLHPETPTQPGERVKASEAERSRRRQWRRPATVEEMNRASWHNNAGSSSSRGKRGRRQSNPGTSDSKVMLMVGEKFWWLGSTQVLWQEQQGQWRNKMKESEPSSRSEGKQNRAGAALNSKP